MLRSHLVLPGIAAAALGLSSFFGCSGGVDSSDAGGAGGSGAGSGTGSAAGGGEPGTHAAPPEPGPQKAADGTGSVTFAVKKLYLGDTKRDGTPDKVNGWKDYGFDLDGKISTAASTGLCKPLENASPKNVYPDGNDGIDNSFGKNILPIILGIAADAGTTINEGIADGSFTIMLDLEKLGADADYNPIFARLYAGGSLDSAPKFDGSDKWPVLSALLSDPNDIKSSKVQFPTSYLTKNTWVSGSKGDIDLTLAVSGFALTLPIRSALVSMEIDASHKTAAKGTIAGVLTTEVLTSELKKVAGAFDPSLCSGPTIDSIIAQLKQASDILTDGSQDPNKPCDGISIGLGFDAAVVQLGDVIKPMACTTDADCGDSAVCENSSCKALDPCATP